MPKGGDYPVPDPRIGAAAIKSAALGEQALAWMQERAKVTDEWAKQDRARYKQTFEPLQDDFVGRVREYGSTQHQAQMANEAVADVANYAAATRGARQRGLAAAGIRPDSGRYQGIERAAATEEALARTGAANVARTQARERGLDLMGRGAGLGAGMASNPLSSYGLGSSAVSSGVSTALSGLGQQGSLLNQQHQNQVQAYQSGQQSASATGEAIGGLAGMAGMLAFASDKDAKKGKRPARGLLEAVKNMPVEEWTYKDGEGDGKRHVGTYAQDFKRETGKGNGRSINVIDAIGVTMGAVKELSDKVDSVANDKRKPKARGLAV